MKPFAFFVSVKIQFFLENQSLVLTEQRTIENFSENKTKVDSKSYLNSRQSAHLGPIHCQVEVMLIRKWKVASIFC